MKHPEAPTHGQAVSYGNVGRYRLFQTHHPVGMSVGAHDHEATCLNLVLDGGYGETLRTRSEVFAANTLLFRPSGVVHENNFESVSANCLLIECDHADLIQVLEQPVRERGPAVSRDPRLVLRAARILSEVYEGDDASMMVVEDLVTSVLSAMLCGRSPTASARVECAEELLRANYRETWSLAALGRQVGLHPAHLGRGFRQLTGCSVGEFVRGLRVLHVIRALRCVDRPIAEIALEAGFSDQSHCTRVFRRFVGQSPSRFRYRASRGDSDLPWTSSADT